MTRRVLKFNFPVDDRWYPQSHPPGSTPCHVACQYDARSVQVWVVEPTVERELVPYEYRVFANRTPRRRRRCGVHRHRDSGRRRTAGLARVPAAGVMTDDEILAELDARPLFSQRYGISTHPLGLRHRPWWRRHLGDWLRGTEVAPNRRRCVCTYSGLTSASPLRCVLAATQENGLCDECRQYCADAGAEPQ